MRKYKVEKLPIVDADFNLKGLITIKDIEKTIQYPRSAKDKGGTPVGGGGGGGGVLGYGGVTGRGSA